MIYECSDQNCTCTLLLFINILLFSKKCSFIYTVYILGSRLLALEGLTPSMHTEEKLLEFFPEAYNIISNPCGSGITGQVIYRVHAQQCVMWMLCRVEESNGRTSICGKEADVLCFFLVLLFVFCKYNGRCCKIFLFSTRSNVYLVFMVQGI